MKLKVLLCILLIGFSSTARAEKKIVCASVGQWPPLEYFDEDGKLTGYTVDLLRAAGSIAGFSIEFKEVVETNIIENLETGEYDAICSSMINEALRRAQLELSAPYLKVQQALVINKQKRMFVHEDWSGKRFGARKDTYGVEIVQKGVKGAMPRVFDTISGAMEAVYIQAIDGAVCDLPVARYYAHSKYKGKLQMNGYLMNSPKKPLSVAVAKGNEEFLELLNKGISTVKLRGMDRELQNKWFSR